MTFLLHLAPERALMHLIRAAPVPSSCDPLLSAGTTGLDLRSPSAGSSIRCVSTRQRLYQYYRSRSSIHPVPLHGVAA
eukprot:25068-Rhodomonas_salina.5